MKRSDKFIPEVCVIGGANIDYHVIPFAVGPKYESTPSKIIKLFGGVARNIAENLSLLNINTALITAISKDYDGKEIGRYCAFKNIDLTHSVVNCTEETSKFIVIKSVEGETEKAFSDLEILKNLTLEKIKDEMEFINKSKICIIDTNLSENIMKYIAENCTVPLFVDTVSASKAIKINSILKNIYFVKPNVNEAQRISKIQITNLYDLSKAAEFFIKNGVKNVCISHSQGVFYANEKESGFIKRLNGKFFHSNIGAGDAFLSGVAYAMVNETNKLSEQVKYGLAASALAVNTYSAVNERITQQSLINLYQNENFEHVPVDKNYFD